MAAVVGAHRSISSGIDWGSPGSPIIYQRLGQHWRAPLSHKRAERTIDMSVEAQYTGPLVADSSS